MKLICNLIQKYPKLIYLLWIFSSENVYICIYYCNIYVFTWLCQVLVAACGIFSLHCSLWNPQFQHMGSTSQPRIELGPPALGVWSLSHGTTYIQGSPYIYKLYMYFYQSSFFLHIFFHRFFFLHIIFILSLQTCLPSYTCIGYTTYLRNQPLLESQYFLSFTVISNCVIKALVCI